MPISIIWQIDELFNLQMFSLLVLIPRVRSVSASITGFSERIINLVPGYRSGVHKVARSSGQNYNKKAMNNEMPSLIDAIFLPPLPC